MEETSQDEDITSPSVPAEDDSSRIIEEENAVTTGDTEPDEDKVVEEQPKVESKAEEVPAVESTEGTPSQPQAVKEESDEDDGDGEEEAEVQTGLAWQPPGDSYFVADNESYDESVGSEEKVADVPSDKKSCDTGKELDNKEQTEAVVQDLGNEGPVLEKTVADASAEDHDEVEHQQSEAQPSTDEQESSGLAEQASSNTAQENEPRSGGNDNKTLKSETEQGEENTHPLLDSSGVSDDSKMSKKEGDGKKDSTQLDTTMETTLSSDEEKDESLNESSQEGNDRQEDPQLTGTDVSVVIGDTQPKPNIVVETPHRKADTVRNELNTPHDGGSNGAQKTETKGSPAGIMDAEELFKAEIDAAADNTNVDVPSPQVEQTTPTKTQSVSEVTVQDPSSSKEDSDNITSSNDASVPENRQSASKEAPVKSTPAKLPKKKIDTDKGLVLGSEDSNLLLNKSTLRNAYRIFVLLLRPKVLKFELIQFLCSHSLPTISVRNILERIPTFSSEEVFKEQEYAGLYRPETTKDELINLDEVLVEREPQTGEFASTKILIGEVLVAIPTGFKLRKIAKLTDKIMASPAFKLLRGNNSIQAPKTDARNEIEKIRQQGLAKNRAEIFTKKIEASEKDKKAEEEESRDLEKRRSRTSEFKFSPDRNGISPLDSMYLSQNQQKSERLQTEQQVRIQNQRHSDNWTAPTASPKATTTIKQLPVVVTPDIQPPVADSPDQSMGLQSPNTVRKALDIPVSPSTNAKEMLSAKRQSELEALRRRSVAKAVNKVFNEKIEQSERSQKAHEEEARDLEERRANKRNYSFTPGSSGISPLDALYMSQNQQKSERIKKEQEVKLQNQRHSDHNVNTWSSPPTSPKFQQKQVVPVDVVATEARLSMTNQQNELEALRQQGVAQAANKSFVEASKSASTHEPSWNHTEIKELEQQTATYAGVRDALHLGEVSASLIA